MTLITPEELADLEAKARAATPGDWYATSDDFSDSRFIHNGYGGDIAEGVGASDAAHVVATRPDVTLRLIATIRALTARAEAAEKLCRKAYPYVQHHADECAWGHAAEVSSAMRLARLLPAEPDHG